ncbi:EH signature domain-containing protein [Vibrio cortegadensis]|uniref:EH signature domain-containing protein n=1 Tax=Vibrio cortegadensis TaxID=1328770 RepID=UPI0021C3BE57|nr:EH signature domain-containing protein [Vibrio cortegadensis]MDN3696186.1 EH signature domain-containing protein [Vibrio cortegadensis]
MSNKGFTFNQPVVPGVNSLDRMSFDDFYNMGDLEGNLPSFPPKTIKQIIQLVDQGKSDQISILEWLDAVENHSQWNDLEASEVNDACRAIWYAMCTNVALGDIAFFKVALALDGKPTSIIPDLIQSMDIVQGVSELADLERKKIDWLQAIRSQSYQSMSQYCFDNNRTPKSYVKYLRLPKANSYERNLSTELVKVAPKPLTSVADLWLQECFRSLKTTNNKLAFCDTVITHFKNFDYGYHVKDILEEKCLPTSDDSFWYSLSEQSKSILKKKFNISSYYELKSISRLLTSDHGREYLELEEHEARQIHSRTMFWSNYSSRFNRIRALLPKLTFQYLTSQGYSSSRQVEVLSEKSIYQCEVLIFELDKVIAVEFLRGDLSETRFFKNTEWNAKRLFESKNLTIEAIREMSQLDVHDHLTSWQYFCEKLLRTKFKLLPNSNIPHFKGLPPAINSYSETRGLPRPEQSYLDERERKLERWVEHFWETEFKTSKYGEQSGLQQKSNVYLSKAYVAKQLGKDEDHELYIKKSANQGNSEAMNQLGQILLRNSDASLRRHGERWLAKAAVTGHENAQTFVEKFKIQVDRAGYFTQRLSAHKDRIQHSDYKFDATMMSNSLKDLSINNLTARYSFAQHNAGDLIIILKELESRNSKDATELKKVVIGRLEDICKLFN